MPLTDPIGAVVAWLKDNSLVAAEVGAAVYAGRLPAALTTPTVNAPAPRAIVVTREPVGLDPFAATYIDVATVGIGVRCYGRTPLEADATYRAVDYAFKHLGRHMQGDTLMYDAIPAIGGSTRTEPDTRWPFVLSRYNVTIAETANS